MHDARQILTGLGAKPRPPASMAAIHRAIEHWGIALPEDALALYTQANGTEESFGTWSWNFWPIDSEELTLSSHLLFHRQFIIEAEQRAINPAKYVRLFDCLLDAPLYACCMDSSSVCFGEVIGCWADADDFYAFVSASCVSRFLEMLAVTRGEEMILVEK